MSLIATAALAWLAAHPALATPQSLVDTATFRGPAADRRAARVGDVLTVLVQEATTARSQAATDADRSTALGVDFDSPSTTYNADLGAHGKSAGAAETRRIGELRARLTVRVVAVEANGLLRVEGEQALVVNGETQRIQLGGLVRPDDISSANTVWSSRIADASVALSGAGVVSESQRQSVVSRVLHWLGLL